MRPTTLPNPAVRRTRTSAHGFTLIEMLVVMTLIGLLLTLAAPRYFATLDNGRLNVQRQNLATMRDAIDKFHGDLSVYPESLEALVDKKYLRAVPADPITERADTWQIVAPPEPEKGKVYNVRSGASEQARDGTQYADW